MSKLLDDLWLWDECNIFFAGACRRYFRPVNEASHELIMGILGTAQIRGHCWGPVTASFLVDLLLLGCSRGR